MTGRAGAGQIRDCLRDGTDVGAAFHMILRLSALDLRPLPTAVPSARLHTRHVLAEWNLGDSAEAAELVVSELVTNAAQAATEAAAGAEPAPVRLRLSARSDGTRLSAVQVEVWDPAPQMPETRHDTPPDEPGGRGLVIVEAVTDRWGIYRARDGGKVVWALICR